MEEKVAQIRIFELNQFNYPKFRGKILRLYVNTFTSGEYAQYIPQESAESTLDEMLRNGSGQMAFIDDKLAGVLIALPLSHDKEFPKEDCFDISVETSVYIAEVMTHPDFWVKDVIAELIENFLRNVKDNYTDVVICIRDENKPVLKLYEKLDFHPITTTKQTKYRTVEKVFEMRKVYLRKNLSPNSLKGNNEGNQFN